MNSLRPVVAAALLLCLSLLAALSPAQESSPALRFVPKEADIIFLINMQAITSEPAIALFANSFITGKGVPLPPINQITSVVFAIELLGIEGVGEDNGMYFILYSNEPLTNFEASIAQSSRSAVDQGRTVYNYNLNGEPAYIIFSPDKKFMIASSVYELIAKSIASYEANNIINEAQYSIGSNFTAHPALYVYVSPQASIENTIQARAAISVLSRNPAISHIVSSLQTSVDLASRTLSTHLAFWWDAEKIYIGYRIKLTSSQEASSMRAAMEQVITFVRQSVPQANMILQAAQGEIVAEGNDCVIRMTWTKEAAMQMLASMGNSFR